VLKDPLIHITGTILPIPAIAPGLGGSVSGESFFIIHGWPPLAANSESTLAAYIALRAAVMAIRDVWQPQCCAVSSQEALVCAIFKRSFIHG